MPVFLKDGTSVLFVHVPKTGGSAIEDVFVESGWDVQHLDRTSRRNPVNRLRSCSPQHMHAELLRLTFRLERFDHVFLVVREPLARFRSEFLWRHRDLAEVGPEHVDAWADDVLRRYADYPFALDNHLRPQAEFVVPGASVHRYEDGLGPVVDDLVGRGLELPAPLRHVPKQAVSGLSSRDVPLSERLHARLLELYAADFAAFYPALTP